MSTLIALAGPLVRHDVVPLALIFLMFLAGVLAAYVWKPAPRGAGPQPGAEPPGLRVLVQYLLATAAFGYAGFLVVVVVFYLAVGGEPGGYFRSASLYGAFLAFPVAIPGLVGFDVAWSAIRRRLRGPRRP